MRVTYIPASGDPGGPDPFVAAKHWLRAAPGRAGVVLPAAPPAAGPALRRLLAAAEVLVPSRSSYWPEACLVLVHPDPRTLELVSEGGAVASSAAAALLVPCPLGEEHHVWQTAWLHAAGAQPFARSALVSPDDPDLADRHPGSRFASQLATAPSLRAAQLTEMLRVWAGRYGPLHSSGIALWATALHHGMPPGRARVLRERIERRAAAWAARATVGS